MDDDGDYNENPPPNFADELRFVRHRRPGPRINHQQDVIDALHEWIMEEPRESVWCMVVDRRGMMIGATTVSVGGFSFATVDLKVIAGIVITAKGDRFILLHNHPSGDPLPSEEDMDMMQAAKTMGKAIGAPLVDFIVLGAEAGQAWSAAQNGKL